MANVQAPQQLFNIQLPRDQLRAVVTSVVDDFEYPVWEDENDDNNEAVCFNFTARLPYTNLRMSEHIRLVLPFLYQTMELVQLPSSVSARVHTFEEPPFGGARVLPISDVRQMCQGFRRQDITVLFAAPLGQDIPQNVQNFNDYKAAFEPIAAHWGVYPTHFRAQYYPIATYTN